MSNSSDVTELSNFAIHGEYVSCTFRNSRLELTILIVFLNARMNIRGEKCY